MRDIMDMLFVGNWSGTELIDIAMGKYEMPNTFFGWIKKITR
jgi:hypothetical protein